MTHTAQQYRTHLRRLFDLRYRTGELRHTTPQQVKAHILGLIDSVDPDVEGYTAAELARQRDLSVRFHWGHDHDFGTFNVKGRMRRRHSDVLAEFMARFNLTPDDFDRAQVLDVGCWTGGTTLMLAALGADVLAIEEVQKYADAANYLCTAFGIEETAGVEPWSLYEIHKRWGGAFDFVHMPGVLYHLSDPVLGLRRAFEALREGGRVLVESAGLDLPGSLCRFDGRDQISGGTAEALDRWGWNRFIATPEALDRMMGEAGFDAVRVEWDESRTRLYACGTRGEDRGICRAGLNYECRPDRST